MSDSVSYIYIYIYIVLWRYFWWVLASYYFAGNKYSQRLERCMTITSACRLVLCDNLILVSLLVLSSKEFCFVFVPWDPAFKELPREN